MKALEVPGLRGISAWEAVQLSACVASTSTNWETFEKELSTSDVRVVQMHVCTGVWESSVENNCAELLVEVLETQHADFAC
jgi:hypothetical protein